MSTSRRKILLMAGAGVVGCSTAAIAGVVAFVAVGEARYANRMYPGVRVDGEDFGGLTLLEARDRMENRWGTFAASPVVFRLGQRLWEPAGREIGVEVDYQTPLADAYAWGRRGGWGTRLGEQRRTLDAAKEWRTSVTFDPHVFMDYIERLIAEISYPATNASLRIENQGGRRHVAVVPARAGREFVPVDFMAIMSRAFDTPQRLLIELNARTIPAEVPTTVVAPVAEAARELSTGHIELMAPGHRWSVARETLATGMEVVGSVAAPEIRMNLSYGAFEPVAREIASTVKVSAVEPKIRVDLDGSIVPLIEGAPGRMIDTEVLWARVREAFDSGSNLVNVPIVLLKPEITQLGKEKLQFDNMISEGVSLYWGSSENRVHNIDVGSRLIDGTVIPPGETFSFNATVGPVTERAGFVEGLVIAPNGTEPGVGGGICQVSTTLFRAVFWAGLPINERWQHVYRVGYYELGVRNPPGFDAAIWQPAQDFTFTNDTPHHIYIKRVFDPEEQSLAFRLMGPSIGREVELDAWQSKEIEPPPMRVEPTTELPAGEIEKTDGAIPGLKTIVHRKVSINGRVLFKDNFLSSFVPWGERWVVGQAEDGSFDPTVIPGYAPPEEPDEGESSTTDVAES